MPKPTKYTTTAGEQLWEIRYRLPSGKSTRKRGFGSAGEAKRWWSETGSKIAAGTLAAQADSSIKVRDWCARWLAGYDERPNTVLRARWAIRKINAEFGGWPLTRVKQDDVDGWLKRLRNEEYAPGRLYADGTVSTIYLVGAQIFKAAVDRDILTRSPFRKPPKTEDQDRRCPTVEQVWSLYYGMEPRYRIVVLLMAFAGMRPSEILGLRRSDLHLTPGEAWVHPKVQRAREGSLRQQKGAEAPLKTKGSAKRIPIPDWLALEIQYHLGSYPDPLGVHVVTKAKPRGNPPYQLTYAMFQLSARKARAQATDWPAGMVLYKLRHFYDTHLSHAPTLSPHDVKDAMRHSSLEMQNVYQHSMPGQDDRIRAVFESISRPGSGLDGHHA